MLNDLEPLISRILEAVAPYEFRTFVLGFDRPPNYDRALHEQEYRGLKRVLGDTLRARLPGTDADFSRPDLRVHITRGGELHIQTAPLFLGGRYRKLSREIPGTRWIHHTCGGRGCAACSHTGNLCGPSVQELLAKPVLRQTGGRHTLFHTLGREDVDARMLGRGRPFVLEVHHPLRRMLNLEEIRREVCEAAGGTAEVLHLELVGHEARSLVKAVEAEKSYRAWLDFGDPVAPEVVARVEALAGTIITQLSPTRVAHRRGKDAVRMKRVLESHWLGNVEGRNVWEARVEAGTYVKELVSGDGGRTRASLAEILGRPCRCVALDVLEVHWAPPWEARDDLQAGTSSPLATS